MSLPSTITAVVNYPSPFVVRLIQKGDMGISCLAPLAATGPGQGAALVSYLAPFTGAVARTQADKDTDTKTVFDFLSSDHRGFVTNDLKTADLQPEINTYVNGVSSLGARVFPTGTYRMDSGLVLDYTAWTTGSSTHPAFPGNRIDLHGNGHQKTFFSFDNSSPTAVWLTIKGGTSIGNNGAAVNGTYTGFTLADYTNAYTRFGVAAYNAAFLTFDDIAIWSMRTGIYTNSVLCSKFSNLKILECYDGMVWVSNSAELASVIPGYTDMSYPNANIVCNVALSNCQHSGFSGTVGAANSFKSIRIEGNGTLGTTGAAGYGGMFMDLNGSNGRACVSIEDAYFEANVGEADLMVSTSYGADQTIILKNVVFNRNYTASNFTKNCLKISNSAGGTLRVILQGCAFSDMAGSTTSANPYIQTIGNVIIEETGCTYSDPNLVTHQSVSRSITGRVSAAGAWEGPAPLGCVVGKAGTGIYSISKNYFASSVSNYSVIVNITDDGTATNRRLRVGIQYNTNYAFNVIIVDPTTGTLTDSGFSFIVNRNS